MRLTCPNCGARYEVPDGVIPAAGRDVQCSDCGKTWHQTPGDDGAEAEDTPPAPQSPPPADDAGPSEEAPLSTSAPRREIDPSVASILHEEADRERRARAAPGGLETQDDLGLDAGQARKREATGRDEARGARQTAHSRLFPDVEEINSSLTSSNAARADAAADATHVEDIARRRPGFRSGFFLMLFLAAIALLTYIYAAQLGEALPPLRAALAEYVQWVDGLRQWLDGQIAALALWLDQMTGSVPAD